MNDRNYVPYQATHYMMFGMERYFNRVPYDELISGTLDALKAEQFVIISVNRDNTLHIKEYWYQLFQDLFHLSALQAVDLLYSLEYTKQVLTAESSKSGIYSTVNLFWPLLKKFKVFDGNIQYKFSYSA